MPPDRAAAILLAGGRGRRIGGDKPFRLLAGRPLLDHVLAAIRPQAGPIAISANTDPALFAAWSLPVLPDGLPDFPGPLAGVLAGLRWAADLHATSLLCVPTDTPFLPPDLVARLATARRHGAPIACATSHGRIHPTVALWNVALADTLAAALHAGERRIGPWLAQQAAAHADFSEHPDPFFNVNTPDDLAEAERLLR